MHLLMLLFESSQGRRDQHVLTGSRERPERAGPNVVVPHCDQIARGRLRSQEFCIQNGETYSPREQLPLRGVMTQVKVIGIVLSLFAIAGLAMAQEEVPGWEVSGGYQY